MFFIIEIQGYEDGTFAQIVTQKETKNEADAEFYRVLAAAAVSTLPIHSAAMIDHTGYEHNYKFYHHKDNGQGNEA